MNAQSPVAIGADMLRALLEYDENTGLLRWKERPIALFPSARTANSWNAKYAGKEAFTTTKDGYRVGHIFKRSLRAHRVAWAIVHGVWVDCDIDHINGDRSDNRMCNLREASRTENNANSRTRSDNTSGFKGVSFYKPTMKWMACIRKNGRSKYLGYFDSPEEAHAAYNQSASRLYGEYARAK